MVATLTKKEFHHTNLRQLFGNVVSLLTKTKEKFANFTTIVERGIAYN